MSRADFQWTQFRRLLLGTVIEELLKVGAQLEFSSIAIAFDDKSKFQVPRFNNYMRFVGSLEGVLLAELDDRARGGVERGLLSSWDDILKSVELPVGDNLTNEKSDVTVTVTGQKGSWRLRVAFDLEAD